MKYKPILLLIVLLVISSCTEHEEKINPIIKVNLKTKFKNNPIMNGAGSVLFIDSIQNKFKGIINKDSSLVGVRHVIYEDLKKLLDSGKITKNQYLNTDKYIYILTGFNEDEHYFIVDKNGNKDFSDDNKFVFKKGLKELIDVNRDILNTLPNIDVKAKIFRNGKIHEDTLGITVYPTENLLYKRYNIEVSKLKKDLNLKANFTDWLYGEFEFGKEKYKVAVGKYGEVGSFILQKKDKPFYKFVDPLYSVYKQSDTLKIDQFYYKIDTVSLNPPQLKLKALDIKGEIYGFRTGDKIRNFKVEDLRENNTYLKDLFKENQLLLLDFWGTWCGPCKELTPDLVQLNKDYNTKVSMASLAYELDPAPVQDYVDKNNMVWYNGIIKGKPKTANPTAKIVKDLRLVCFPTFILIDKDMNIIYRTCGNAEAFRDLKDFIANY